MPLSMEGNEHGHMLTCFFVYVVGFTRAFARFFVVFIYCLWHCTDLQFFVAGTHEAAKDQNLTTHTHIPSCNPRFQSPMTQNNSLSPQTRPINPQTQPVQPQIPTPHSQNPSHAIPAPPRASPKRTHPSPKHGSRHHRTLCGA